MIRISMIVLCLLLAAAAAGRYQAEVRVREAREELRKLDRLEAEEVAQIQLLRAEVAYLESPDRLVKVAKLATSLKPMAGVQLYTADDFALAFSAQPTPTIPGAPVSRSRAVAMVEVEDQRQP